MNGGLAMSAPVWTLLLFAAWTLATLLGTVGIYRWSRILTGRARLGEFHADEVQGTDFYRRAMRAHANCVENLPVYAALVIVIVASGVRSPTLDRLAIAVLIARVLQTLTHLAMPQSDTVVGVRFAFFFVQLAAMVGMGIVVAVSS